MTRAGISTVLIAWGVAVVQVAPAIPISIDNPGFEADLLPDGGFTVDLLTAWNYLGVLSQGPSFGAFNPTTENFPGEAPEGQNTAYINTGSAIQQILSAVLEPDTLYTLTVQVGDRLDTFLPGYEVQLLAGGNLLARDLSFSPPFGGFVLSTVSYFASSGGPFLGQALEIRLLGGPEQVNFDDVRLDAKPATVVPEPRTLLLLGPGLLAIWIRRRY